MINEVLIVIVALVLLILIVSLLVLLKKKNSNNDDNISILDIDDIGVSTNDSEFSYGYEKEATIVMNPVTDEQIKEEVTEKKEQQTQDKEEETNK